MGDSVLLNDGSSFLLLNDGSSHVLLNAHEGGGVTIQSTHATQKTVQKKRLVPLEFVFWVRGGLKTKIHIKLQQLEKLLHAKPLRETHTFPVAKLKQNILKSLKRILHNYSMEMEIAEGITDPGYLARLLFELLKRSKK